MGDVESLAGRVLAEKYHLTERLGEGGFGSIWRAEHLVLRSPVAVKLIDLDMARRDGAVERFVREAQATAALRSPHVVQVLDYGVDKEQPFIVMELLEGENLAQRLEREKRLPLLEVVRIVTHVARAIGKAHELGIVHRDLKPENIFLVNTGDEELAKVLDFGVAKFAATTELSRDTYTKTGALIGTPYYMSPEQAQGNKTVDSRSDLWALGVITFEMITGQRPFDGDALGDLVLTICVRSISVPSSVACVPEGFDAWFAKAVERDPNARFQTAREMALALIKLIDGGFGDDTGAIALLGRATPPGATPATELGADIPSRPTTSAFAATVRDDSSELTLPELAASSPLLADPSAAAAFAAVPEGATNGSAPLPLVRSSPLNQLTPLPPVRSSPLNQLTPPPPAAGAVPNAAAPVSPLALPSASSEPYEPSEESEEHLPPWAVIGIALLALAAGAAAVYGVFFLMRAHDDSNDPLKQPNAALSAPAGLSASRRGGREYDVPAPNKPSTSHEGMGARALRPNAPVGSNSKPEPRLAPGHPAAPGAAPSAPSLLPSAQSGSVPAPAAPPANLTPGSTPAAAPAAHAPNTETRAPQTAPTASPESSASPGASPSVYDPTAPRTALPPLAPGVEPMPESVPGE